MQPDQPDPLARVIESYAVETANLRIAVEQLRAQVEALRAEAHKEGGGAE